MPNVCGNYPYLFYLLKFQVDQKTFLVNVSMTNFPLIKSGMQISFLINSAEPEDMIFTIERALDI